MATKEYGIQATADITDVESKLGSLIDLLSSIPDVISKIDVEDNVSAVEEEVRDKLVDLDGETAAVDIEAEDNASPMEEEVKDKLNELDGQKAIVEIDATDNASEVIDNATTATYGLQDAVAGSVSALALYKFGLDGLNYQGYIGQAVAFGNATSQQRVEMEATVKANSSAKYQVDTLAGAMTYLNKQTGDAGLANKLFGTELKFIKDNGASLEDGMIRLTNLYKLYGLDAEGAAAATAMLDGEILKSGYSGDQFLNMVSKASTDLKNMGFTLQDTGAIVASFGQSGINADQAMRMMRSGFSQFIKEFDTANPKLADYEAKIKAVGVATRDANGHLRSSKDVMSDLLETFARMPAGPEKTRLAIELFGSQAGKVLGNLKVDYKDVEDAAGNSAQSQIDEARRARSETQDPLQIIINKLKELASEWGVTGSSVITWAGVIAQSVVGLAAIKFLAGDRISGFSSEFLKRMGLDSLRPAIQGKIDALKGKFELPDLFNKGGGSAKFEISIVEDAKGNIVIEEAKINSFVDRVKVKVGELKGKFNLFDLFKEEKGAINIDFGSKIGEMTSQITSKLPTLESIGSKIPEAVTNGITSKLPTLDSIGDTIGSKIGTSLKTGIPKFVDGASIGLYAATVITDALTHVGDFMEDPWSLIMGGSFFSPSNFVPEPLKNLLSPEAWARYIWGDGTYDQWLQYAKMYVEDPIKGSLQGVWDGLVGFAFGLPSLTPNLNISWGNMTHGLDDAKNYVYGRWNEAKAWLDVKRAQISGALTISWSRITTGLSDAKGYVEGRFNDLQSYLRSVPGKMYSMGSNAIGSLVSGFRSQFPNFSGALDWIRSHLPNSPPEQGPLSKTTEETWYNWSKSLVNAGMSGLSEFRLDEASVLPDIGNMNIPGDNASSSDSKQVTLQINVDKGAVQINGPATPETVEKAGTSLATGIYEGMRSNGIPLI